MTVQSLTDLIGAITTLIVAVISLIAAFRANSKANATQAQLTGHVENHPRSSVSPPNATPLYDGDPLGSEVT